MIEKGKTRTENEIDFIFCSTLWIRTINNAVEQCQTVETTNLNDKKLSLLLHVKIIYHMNSFFQPNRFFLFTKAMTMIQNLLLHNLLL